VVIANSNVVVNLTPYSRVEIFCLEERSACIFRDFYILKVGGLSSETTVHL